LGYFFVFLLLGRPVRLQLAAGTIVLTAYWAWMVIAPAPDPLPDDSAASIASLLVPRGVAEHFAIYTNAPARADVVFYRWLMGNSDLGPHTAGYATLNFVPASVTILLGVIAGSLLRSPLDGLRKRRQLFWGGAICLTVALLASVTVCPLIKKIWTPAWTLYSGGWMLWFLAMLYWMIDIRGCKWWTFPFVVVGMNSLAIYLMSMLMKRPITQWLQVYLGDDLFAGAYGPTLQAIAVFVVLWLFAFYFYRQRIFFRV
jgi:predicted acyltransferase